MILLDSSVLIDYFRKKNKEKTFFYQLAYKQGGFAIPVMVHYEILSGSNSQQENFWHNLFNDFLIISYTAKENYTAITIKDSLKKKRKTIDFKDLLIAATAISHKMPLATLNKDHFIAVPGLTLITPDSFQ
ncbi:MAG: type II toxin-antitoxin system VapC family toxin [Sphingobacteriales bacterium]|nr:type II toxin-antitoxin system VapC family toxin [Sphingobacteriales bacterium]MBI3717915.1 type II toxin-antitoxin system VapC family toxin [Sphingobacteriales bacterium]